MLSNWLTERVDYSLLITEPLPIAVLSVVVAVELVNQAMRACL